jgi:hypothetical protein
MPVSDQCPTCAHYRGLLTCAAFPDRIPQAILDGSHDHREAFPGDNGIRFEEWDPASTDEEPAEPAA